MPPFGLPGEPIDNASVSCNTVVHGDGSLEALASSSIVPCTLLVFFTRKGTGCNHKGMTTFPACLSGECSPVAARG